MKYFTKYLPVEGIPKYLDRYKHKLSDDVYQNTDTSGQVDYSDCQLVKLYLCSRDNPKQAQEILTEGIIEGQEFSEKEKDYLTLGSVVEK